MGALCFSGTSVLLAGPGEGLRFTVTDFATLARSSWSNSLLEDMAVFPEGVPDMPGTTDGTECGVRTEL